MDNILRCPACGAPLTYSGHAASMLCPYCQNTVIPPEELRKVVPLPDETAAKPVKAKTLRAIARLARTGREIEAVHVILQNFKVGRDKAKQAVRLLAAGKPAHLGEIVVQPDISLENED